MRLQLWFPVAYAQGQGCFTGRGFDYSLLPFDDRACAMPLCAMLVLSSVPGQGAWRELFRDISVCVRSASSPRKLSTHCLVPCRFPGACVTGQGQSKDSVEALSGLGLECGRSRSGERHQEQDREGGCRLRARTERGRQDTGTKASSTAHTILW